MYLSISSGGILASALLASGLALAPGTAPPGDWAGHRGTPGLRGVAPGSLGAEFAVRWTYEAGGAIASSPVVADGRVFVGADDQKLHAVDLASGEGLWSFETQDLIEAPPFVHAGIVYVGSSDYFFYALDAETGVLRWKAETGDRILGGANVVSAPDGAGSWIVVGSYDASLYCFDALTGEKRWQYETGNYVNGTPAVYDNRIVFGGCDAILHVVDGATGEAAAQLDLCPDCHVAGSVALVDGLVYFGHYGNAFVCASLEKNELLWSFESRQAFFSSPSVGEELVIVGGRDKRLHALVKETGLERWSFKTRRKVDSSPVICGDAVVFGTADGRLYVLNLADGEERWSYEIGKPILSSPAVVDGTLIVGAGDGHLYAFGPPAEESQEDGR